MNLVYKVLRNAPHLGIQQIVGYARYNTCSDTWSDEVFADLEMTELRGEYTCRNQYHGREEVILRRYHGGEADFTMRGCVICRCLVTPPFDGYTYHDYDCPMDEGCVCDHDPAPATALPADHAPGPQTSTGHRPWCWWLRYYMYRATIGNRVLPHPNYPPCGERT